MNRFEIIKDIDEGAFGIVQMARNKETGEIVAIKKIKRKYNNWEECMSLREIKSLKKLKHPNIIKLKEVFKLEQELFLVFEYCRTNLFKLYNDEYKAKGRPMPESMIKSLVYQIVSSLAYIHKLGFFHRDLKPENILITERNVLKMADFGLAREIRSSPPYTEYVSTRWYRAPEILLKSTNYNSPVDIFALGCIMAELYMQAPLFNGASEIDQLSKIFAVLGNPGKSWPEGIKLASSVGFAFPTTPAINLSDIIRNASHSAIDLMRSMLNFDSSKRPTAAKILQHPYFSNNSGTDHNVEYTEQVYKPQPIQVTNINNPLKNVSTPKNLDYISTKFGSEKQVKMPSKQHLHHDNSKENMISPFREELRMDNNYGVRSELNRPYFDQRQSPHTKAHACDPIYKSDLTGKKDALDLDIEELENEIFSTRKRFESPNSNIKKEQKENQYNQSAFTTKLAQNFNENSNNSRLNRQESFLNQNLLNDPLEELLNKEQMLIEEKEERTNPYGNFRNNNEVPFMHGNRMSEFNASNTDDYLKMRPIDNSMTHKYGISSSTKKMFQNEGMFENNAYSHTPSYLNGINILNKIPKATYQTHN
jgi:serine/threonine protein kinase